jgi:hypothetical protein
VLLVVVDNNEGKQGMGPCNILVIYCTALGKVLWTSISLRHKVICAVKAHQLAGEPIAEPVEKEPKPAPIVEKRPKLEPYLSAQLTLSVSAEIQKVLCLCSSHRSQIVSDNVRHDPSFGLFIALLANNAKRNDIIMQILQSGVDFGFDLESQSNSSIKILKCEGCSC